MAPRPKRSAHSINLLEENRGPSSRCDTGFGKGSLRDTKAHAEKQTDQLHEGLLCSRGHVKGRGGRRTGAAGTGAASDASIPCGRWFESLLLHFPPSSLLMAWEKQRKMAQVGDPDEAPGFGLAQLQPL